MESLTSPLSGALVRAKAEMAAVLRKAGLDKYTPTAPAPPKALRSNGCIVVTVRPH